MLTALEFEKENRGLFNEIEQALEKPDDATLNELIQVLNDAAGLAVANCSGMHLPNLDRILLKIAGIMKGQERSYNSFAGKSIILVSELYLEGGHSRIVEDIVSSIPDDVLIIISDYKNNYLNGRLKLGEMYDRFRMASVVTIPMGSNVSKIHSLKNLINSVSPQKLYLLLHHTDAIGYVAASAHNVSGLKRFFIHHTDHKPSLGTTLSYEKHLDTTSEYCLNCEASGIQNCSVLPLYVKDQDARAGTSFKGRMNFASVGSTGKFTFEGALDHADRIVKCLQFDHVDNFYHIGQLQQNSIDKINLALLENGIKSERFKYIMWVPSVWKTLVELDVHVLIASAPLGGGRTAIEAQGAGIPVLFYEDVFSKSIYGAPELFWTDHSNLYSAIVKVSENYSEYSQKAREYYEKYYSEEPFKKSLGFETDAR